MNKNLLMIMYKKGYYRLLLFVIIGITSSWNIAFASCCPNSMISTFDSNETVIEDTSFKVVGYLRPKGFKTLDYLDLSKTTHVMLSFANVDSNGVLVFEKGIDFTDVVQKLQLQGVKVIMSIGGGGVSESTSSNWNKYIRNDREKLISGIVDYVEIYNLDGIDIDFEGDFIRSLGDHYNVFSKELQVALHSKGLSLSAAFPGRFLYGNVTKETLQVFDFINVMSYGVTHPNRPKNPGQHSPMWLIQTAVDFWHHKRGVSLNKIIFGLPFMGFDFSEDSTYKWGIIWRNIIKNNPENGYVDRHDQMWYNGIPTIAKKTHRSMELFGGVMVWSYEMDVNSDMSLLKVINQVVDAGLKEGAEIKTFFADEDGDGYGNIYKPLQAYEPPQGYVLNRKDLNDRDTSVHP
ncbi:hypothetical protein K5X82_04545 [Halosquirtibacter xylanolyticus]|uniref:glycosyl hydrolase family 18 protein n=1 Tax=Halosquirtibacter xylanolyticus TaxID=3374599 RepID=UPI003749E9DF|nr:hypothetical protein K5X82_04545 [Prolixibacteraceae bacterium]